MEPRGSILLVVTMILVSSFPISLVSLAVSGDFVVSPPSDCSVIVQPCFKPTYVFGVNRTVTLMNNYGDKVALNPAIAGYAPSLARNTTAFWYSGSIGACSITMYYRNPTSTFLELFVKWSGCPTGTWNINVNRIGGGAFTVIQGCNIKSDTITIDLCHIKASGASVSWTGSQLRIVVSSSSGFLDPGIYQNKACAFTTVTTIACAFAAQSLPTDQLVAAISWSTSVTAETFSDSISNVWNEIGSATNTGECAIAWAPISSSNVVVTITASWTGSASGVMNIYELSTIVATGYRKSTATGTSTTPSVTSTGNSATQFGIACVATASSVTITAGTGLTLDTTAAAGGAEHIQTPLAGNTYAFTLSSSVAWAEVAFAIDNGINHAETVRCSGAATTTLTCAYTEPVGQGDVLVVSAGRVNVGGTWSISDTVGNTWTSVTTASNTAKAQIWYSKATKIGANTITINYNDVGSQQSIICIVLLPSTWSVNGITSGTGTGTGTSFATGSTATDDTNGREETMIATSASMGTFTAGASYTSYGTSVTAGACELARTLAAGTTTFPATSSVSTTWAQVGIALSLKVSNRLTFNPSGTNTPIISTTNYFNVTYTLDGVSTITRAVGGTFPITAFLADPSQTITVSAITQLSHSPVANREWAITYAANVATTTAFSDGKATTFSKTLTYFEAFSHTFTITPSTPSTWDASRTIKIDCNQMGILGTCTTFTPADGDGSKSATFYTDNSQIAVCEASTGGASGQSWVPSAQQTASLGTPGGDTITCSYILLTDHFTTTTSTTSTTLTTSTQTNNLVDPPNYLWLLLVPIALIVLVAAKKRL